MGKKLFALAISDIHIHNWKSHNIGFKRTKDTMDILNSIALEAEKHSVPILCPGDLFHGEVGSRLLHLVEDLWPAYFRENLYVISGNHDQEEKSSEEAPTNSMVTYFARKGALKCLDFTNKAFRNTSDSKRVFGIPYLTYNRGLTGIIKEYGELEMDTRKILMIHTDIHGAKEVDGREVGTVENLPKDLHELFKDFDLVLCGHIHRPQEIIPGKVIMVGSPNQQKKSDSEGTFGYWEIYEDLSYKFKPLDNYPKFKFYPEGSVPEDDYNYWVMVREDGEETPDEDSLEFSAHSTATKLGKAYLRAIKEERYSYKKALIETLKQAEDDYI